jgi:hypothetical protein
MKKPLKTQAQQAEIIMLRESMKGIPASELAQKLYSELSRRVHFREHFPLAEAHLTREYLYKIDRLIDEIERTRNDRNFL